MFCTGADIFKPGKKPAGFARLLLDEWLVRFTNVCYVQELISSSLVRSLLGLLAYCSTNGWLGLLMFVMCRS